MDDEKTIRTLKILFILTIVFILYNTLIPFKLITRGWEIRHHLHQADWVPFIINGGQLNPISDIIGNTLLFLPFGFFLTLYYLAKGRSARMLPLTFWGMLFSMFIEFLQIGFRYRTPSTTDIIMNTIGTALGVAFARIYFRSLAVRVQRFIEATLENEPITLILLLIIFVQFFGSLLPFNVTITISDLKHSLARANIQPFGVKTLGMLFGASHAYARSMVFSRIKFLGNMIFYAIYGYLVMYAYFQYWRKRPEGKLILISLLILYFPLLEITQFFIRSRTSDINDVISGYAGALIGIALFWSAKKEIWFREVKTIELRHFMIPIVLYLVYVFYSGLSPFRFTTDLSRIQANLKIHNLVPFYAYYKVTSLWNIYDLFESFFMLMPLGFVWALLKNKDGISKRPEVQAIVLGLFISLLIEGAQVFLPGRTGEMTDVIMNTFGCYAGAWFYRYYYRNYLQKNAFIRSLTEKPESSGAVIEQFSFGGK